MMSSTDGRAVVDEVVALGGDDPDGLRSRFLRDYYEHVAPEDLVARSAADLLAAALGHWAVGAHRPAGQPVVRISNPDVEPGGWACAHTVVDIVTDDMPFLVDSVTMVLAARDLGIHAVVHPMLHVARDAGGSIVAVGAGHPREAWIHLEVDRQGAAAARDELAAATGRALHDVRLVVDDWMEMREQAQAIADEIRRGVPMPRVEAEDAADLLRWMAADHFTFLGFRDYEIATEDGHDVLRALADTGRGLLRDANRPPRSQRLDELPPAVRDRVREPRLLVVTKANSRSTVHRPDYFAYVSVKRFGREGEVVGERRFIGLWAASVYRSRAVDIPLLRRKVQSVQARSELPLDSHGGRELRNILETFPRDDLFQIGADELFTMAMGILNLQERRQVRLFARRDDYGRFVSCLIYVPRDRYSTAIVERMNE
ncbi:MAG TPA: hypothetical protein VGF22_18950, partial [Acidimicrobiales bacterium]